MCLLFGLIAQTRRHAWQRSRTPCGVLNGTPHGFLFDEKLLLAVSKILLWIGY